MPFRAALGTGKTERRLSTSPSPVLFPTAAPGNLWMFLTALGPVRETYQAVKYRSVASEQSRAVMIAGELHIHKICASLIEPKSEWELLISPKHRRKREKMHESTKRTIKP